MYLGKFLNCSDKCILSTVQTRATGDFDESDRSEKVIQTNQLNFVRIELLDNWDTYNVFQQPLTADAIDVTSVTLSRLKSTNAIDVTGC